MTILCLTELEASILTKAKHGKIWLNVHFNGKFNTDLGLKSSTLEAFFLMAKMS